MEKDANIMLKTTSLLALFIMGLISSIQVSAEVVHVEIKKFEFIPQYLTINVGDSIVWTNKEKRQYHSVWFEEAGDPEPDYFFPDESYQRTFNQVGRFNYRCGPHPKMIGIVQVQ
jgi:plastocyanin